MQRFTLKQDGHEKRILSAKFEVRAEDGKPSRITGYAAVFNKRSVNFGSKDYPFYEIIEPGAFREVLKDDVKAVIDHRGGLATLARTKSGTLSISEDDLGLRFEFEPPDTQAGRDIMEILKRGDIDQASFAFTVKRGGDKMEENDKGEMIRTILAGGIERLYDVSVVTEPAYPDTLVQARDVEHLITQKRLSKLAAEKDARERRIRMIELQAL